MILRIRPIHPDVFFRIGLGAFALTGLLHLFVHPGGPAAQDWLDGARGFSVGVLVAALGVAAWKKRSGAR